MSGGFGGEVSRWDVPWLRTHFVKNDVDLVMIASKWLLCLLTESFPAARNRDTSPYNTNPRTTVIITTALIHPLFFMVFVFFFIVLSPPPRCGCLKENNRPYVDR